MGDNKPRDAKEFMKGRVADPSQYHRPKEESACPHCGSGSKFHSVSARYCAAYEKREIEQLEERALRAIAETQSKNQRIVELEAQVASLTELPEVEFVAATVHAAWVEKQRADGIITAPSRITGEEQMRPYSQLSEIVKEYDRILVLTVYAAIEIARAELSKRAASPEPK